MAGEARIAVDQPCQLVVSRGARRAAASDHVRSVRRRLGRVGRERTEAYSLIGLPNWLGKLVKWHDLVGAAACQNQPGMVSGGLPPRLNTPQAPNISTNYS